MEYNIHLLVLYLRMQCEMEKPKTYPYKIEPSTEFGEKWKHIESVKVIADTKTIRAPTYYPSIAEEIYNFKVRPDDVWVNTFPKSGTTLAQELAWLIVNDDYETAKKVPLVLRFPYLEAYSHFTSEYIEAVKRKIQDKDELKIFEEVMNPHWITLANATGRRFIKSHLQFPLLPPDLLTSGCKIIYVARNPKDAAVSLFKFRGPNATVEDFPEFWSLFQNDCIENSPYWEHVKAGWNQRYNKNLCFLFYEDMVKDIRSTIRQVAAFLGKTMTDKQVEKLADHVDINNFRNNSSVTRAYSYYMRQENSDGMEKVRKGKVNGWKDYFTEEINATANKWIEDNYKQTDLRFPVNFK